VDPVPDPLLLRKSGSAGDRTRDLCICSQKLWPLDHRGGLLIMLLLLLLIIIIIIFNEITAPSGPGLPYYPGCTITLRHTTLGGTPLDEWSTRRRDLSQPDITQRLHETNIISPAGFEPATTASERSHTHALEGAATGIDIIIIIIIIIIIKKLISSFWLTPGCHGGSLFNLNAYNKAVSKSGWGRNGMCVDGSCHDLLWDTIP